MSRFSGFSFQWPRADPCFTDELAAVTHAYKIRDKDTFTDILRELESFRLFDEHIPRMLCEKGDQLLKSWETLVDAVFMYTEAIYEAPLVSRWLAIAHGNRAVALYKLDKLEESYSQIALYDCECALEFNHPEVKTIHIIKEKISASLKNAAVPDDLPGLIEDPNLLAWTSESFRNIEAKPLTGKKFKIQRSEERGRFTVADENIEVGEIILSEECLEHLWFRTKHRTFGMGSSNDQLCLQCDNCLESNIVPFPCYKCRAVFYCSKKCRSAHDYIHRVECWGYKVNFFGQDLDIFQFAMHFFVSMFDSLLQKLQHSAPFQGAQDMWLKILETVKDGEFLSFFSDFRHFQKKISVIESSFKAALMANYLMTKTDFCDRTRVARIVLMESEIEWLVLISALLLRLTSIASYNQFCIQSIILDQMLGIPNIPAGDLFRSTMNKTLAAGLYKQTNMINHSCSPNAYFTFQKSRIIIAAIRPIVKGDEITITYRNMKNPCDKRMFHYYISYGFFCSCTACLSIEEPNFKKHYGIVCSRGLCGATYLANQEACPRCGDVYSPAFYDHIETDAESIPDSVEKFNYLYREFHTMERLFPKTSDQRQTLISTILYEYASTKDYEVKQNAMLNQLMLNLAIDLLKCTEARLPKSSSSFSMATACFMDILAIRKKHGMPPVPINFNFSKIKEAIGFLAPSTNAVFLKYFYSYVADYCVC